VSNNNKHLPAYLPILSTILPLIYDKGVVSRCSPVHCGWIKKERKCAVLICLKIRDHSRLPVTLAVLYFSYVLLLHCRLADSPTLCCLSLFNSYAVSGSVASKYVQLKPLQRLDIMFCKRCNMQLKVVISKTGCDERARFDCLKW
jgi:hypothetical protein